MWIKAEFFNNSDQNSGRKSSQLQLLIAYRYKIQIVWVYQTKLHLHTTFVLNMQWCQKINILHINLFNNLEVCFRIIQPIRTSLAYVLYKTSILRINTINLFPNPEFCFRMVQPMRTNLAFCQIGRTEIRCRISWMRIP